jgi:hypothetical protein
VGAASTRDTAAPGASLDALCLTAGQRTGCRGIAYSAGELAGHDRPATQIVLVLTRGGRVQHVASPDRRAMPFSGPRLGILGLHGQLAVGLQRGGCRVRRIPRPRIAKGRREFEFAATAPTGAGIAADRYLRVRLAPATMTASSTTLGCHGSYRNPRTHGVARQQHLKTCASDRSSHAETVETVLQSLELDFATRLD